LARKADNRYFHSSWLMRPFFYAMLRDFLEAGYSFQWKYLKSQDYGVPQIRERIIIIAAWYTSQQTNTVRVNRFPPFPQQPMVLLSSHHTDASQMQYLTSPLSTPFTSRNHSPCADGLQSTPICPFQGQ
jgi:site-specific DNA-cytosine methylase